jgi:hypothetical protein
MPATEEPEKKEVGEVFSLEEEEEQPYLFQSSLLVPMQASSPLK